MHEHLPTLHSGLGKPWGGAFERIGQMRVTAGAAERSKKWGGGGAEAGGRDEWGGGVFDKEYQSAPVNCKADKLSAFCASRAKMSAIRTRHDKTTLLVTKGDNGHFRTLRAITYKKILNKSNAILAACLHLLATFGLQCPAFACKKNTICKEVPPRPPPMRHSRQLLLANTPSPFPIPTMMIKCLIP